MKKTEWFTAYRYVVPADYEKWFEALAEKGWHPVKIAHFSSMRMVFEKSEPKRYKYAIELLGRLSQERKAMYDDFGWEYVGRMSNVFVWRKAYTDKMPEMFSDKPTYDKRNQRFSTAIGFSFGLFLLGFLINAGLALFKLLGKIATEWLDIGIGLAVYGAGALLLAWVIRRIKAKKSD